MVKNNNHSLSTKSAVFLFISLYSLPKQSEAEKKTKHSEEEEKTKSPSHIQNIGIL